MTRTSTAVWGLCPSAAIFGIYCPGCGGLRAVNDLTHGDVGAAASSNLLFFVSIPLVVFLLARWGYDAWRGGSDRGRTWLSSWPTIYAGLGIALVFTIARNLPMGCVAGALNRALRNAAGPEA